MSDDSPDPDLSSASLPPVSPSALSEPPTAHNPVLASLDDDDRAALAGFLDEVRVPAETPVVQEGENERSMYFVLAGEAVIVQGDMDLGTVRPGEHFGELGLVAARPRAASVLAVTAMTLARLSPAGYEALCATRPALACRFLQALMDGVASRLADMTESVGLLLHERSLPRRTRVRVLIQDQPRMVRAGTPVGALVPHTIDGRRVVAALIDRKLVALLAPVVSECSIEPLTTAHWEVQRIYRHSIGLLLLEAARRCAAPPLHMEHSVGFAQRVAVCWPDEADEAARAHLAETLADTMRELAAEDRPLREELWAVDEAREHFTAAGWTEAVELLRIWRDFSVRLVSYGAVYALRMGPLIPSTGLIEGFRILPDDHGLLLLYGSHAASRPIPVELDESSPAAGPAPSAALAAEPETLEAAAAEPAPGDGSDGESIIEQSFVSFEARVASQHATVMTEEHTRWLAALRMSSVGAFNRACIDGDVAQLIMVSEGFQEKRIGRIADEIRACDPLVKVVCIAGPTSSGKSTFIRRLRVQLQVSGLRPVGLSLDDYYVDRHQTPRDAGGEYDFEAFEAMRVDLLGDHISRLLAGETVETARYDFLTGRSYAAGGPTIQLGAHDVLMLEGIHGLNPRLLTSIPGPRVFRVFVCPLAQLPFDRLTRVHASDVRLIRRIVRDRHGRGYNAAENVIRWPSVRAGERKHIFPFQRYADAVFDSSLIYELSVLKVYAERYLLEVPQKHPAYTTAYRLLGLLDRFVTIYPDRVPATSLLREFIGGSGFDY
ncbi:cyclic nucleotide-binding domain-containing protein [Haliangium sp.]|uniref:cyclic nucleotide-binding domain-containing protein n=1 Tax=Haliangium sp. TaxID=2663208 RepID=UPI003D0F729F